MPINSATLRIVSRANDFDVAGLGIISYYLRLYAVEQILNEKDRSKEETQIASDLLDKVEVFKVDIDALEDGLQEKITLNSLVEESDKAKTYMLNFTMSLYNKKLVQMKDGPWDKDLIRALLCCVDLFSCIVHLWTKDTEEINSLNKKIKYCKVYISRIMKGQVGGTPDEEVPGTIVQEESDLEDIIGDENIPDDGEHEETIGDENIPNDSLDDELNDMKAKLSNIAREPSNEPVFVDSESESGDESEVEPVSPVVSVPKVSGHTVRVHSPSELQNMMDKSSAIEQMQKHAKYAISALNYEDFGTAREELTKALDLLNNVEQQSDF